MENYKNYIYIVDVTYAGCADVEGFDIEADTKEEARKLAKIEAHKLHPDRRIRYARPDYRESNFPSDHDTGMYFKGK